ncbi:MAG: hypothetical protein O7G85_16690 [Planctomycetota bacterium]|nr:hypothetical protein [Planctomycetota bacterium]
MNQDPNQDNSNLNPKIKPMSPGYESEVPLGGGGSDMPIAQGSPAAPKTIRAFEREEHTGSKWKRKPVQNGTGACHVRSFHSKLTDEALKYMDDTINEWLDANPDFEVKFCTSTVGQLTGKLKEPHLICQIWV